MKRESRKYTSIPSLPMPLLIDGYNLLNATGIVGRGGPSSLGRSRLALLNFLAGSNRPAGVLAHTTAVF